MIGYGIGELFTRMIQYGSLGSISIVEPTWAIVSVHLDILDKKFSIIKYNNFFELSIEKLKKGSTDTLYIANPNGINGTVVTKKDIISLLPYYKYVICDEAYMDFSNQSVIEYYQQYSNLIILKSFSKTVGVPGLRFGFAICSDIEFIDRMQSTRPNYLIVGPVLELIPKLCKIIPDHISRMNITKKYIESKYDTLPSEGNYVLLRGCDMIDLNNVSVKEVSPNIYRMALFNIELFDKIFI
jgi:histidinol-phosphate/aromatic aminotransferase/cobyric acid decarboxylase-like protein